MSTWAGKSSDPDKSFADLQVGGGRFDSGAPTSSGHSNSRQGARGHRQHSAAGVTFQL